MSIDIFIAIYVLIVMPLFSLIAVRRNIASGWHEQVRETICEWEETDPLDREYWFKLR